MVYISDTAKLCSLDSGEIEKAVEARRRSKAYSARLVERRELINPPRNDPKGLGLKPEQKAQRGIIAFLFHSPDMLNKVESRVSEDDFSDEFYRRVFNIAADRIKKGVSVDLSSIGDEFSAQEVGRITGIINENNLLPYQKERLSEYIRVLEKQRDRYGGKKPEEMSNEELLEHMERIRKEKRR